MSPKESIPFDRAAEYYDATRILPDDTLEAVLATIAGLVRDRGRCLEVGVGTGRIALPLASSGVDVVGIDLSGPMVAKLVEKGRSVPVALAEATALPFRDASFGAALAIHVLHLIAGWERAVREMARVLRPGGLLVFDLGGFDPRRPAGWLGPAREIEDRLMAEAGIEPLRRLPGITNTADLDRVLAERGAVGRDLDPIEGVLRVPLRVFVDLFEHGAFSWTWPIEPEKRRRVAVSVRTWAGRRYGDLDEPGEVPVTVALRMYEVPHAPGRTDRSRTG